MAVVITDKNTSIEFNIDGEIHLLSKTLLHCKHIAGDNHITIHDSIDPSNDIESITINYLNISSPTVASGDDLYALILSYISSTTENTTIDIVHKRIHQGLLYSSGFYTSSLADNGEINILIKIGATTTHFNYIASCGGDFITQIFKIPTYSNVGTAIGAENHSQVSTNTFNGNVYHTPTLTGNGTQLNGTVFFAGGNGGNSTGSTETAFTSEFVLKTNTDYLVKITNVSGQAKKASITTTYYQYPV